MKASFIQVLFCFAVSFYAYMYSHTQKHYLVRTKFEISRGLTLMTLPEKPTLALC